MEVVVILLALTISILSVSASTILKDDDAKTYTTPSDITYTIYTRYEPEGVKLNIDTIDILNTTAYDGRFKFTFFIIYDTDNPEGRDDYYLAEKILRSSDVNVFSVDWSRIARLNYPPQEIVVKLADYFTEFILEIMRTYRLFLVKTALIGNGLTAHSCGRTAATLNGLISNIIALDPVRIESENVTTFLNTSTTHYLNIIHSSGGHIGIGESFGHVDYFPNGGEVQPGCEDDKSGICSHKRALAYYIESLSTNQFIARSCSSYEAYSQGLCDDAARSIMGRLFRNIRTYGDYYLDTNREPPYARG